MTGAGQRVAIITGGSQGIGAGLVAAAYRRRDWAVVAKVAHLGAFSAKVGEHDAGRNCMRASNIQNAHATSFRRGRPFSVPFAVTTGSWPSVRTESPA
jgi:NAD(P)-dependent dehydrogenase (short-subunit alcohol dehydrogenase family)